MRKKFLAVLLALCMLIGLMVVPASAAGFDDVPEDHWAAGAIERWNGYGVLNGHDDGTFTPDKAMTRAEFAQMLVNMMGYTAKSSVTFSDVPSDAWYAEVISIAVAAGIMNGYSDGTARPGEPVTFEQAAVMLCRALGLAKTTGGADWAKESIEKLTSLGMIGEGADEHLQVGVECDRAVVAALADTVVAEYVNEDRDAPITGEVKGVVVVVNQAKVEIKDAVVSAPIVVESAEVTLTNTKAENVVVGGSESAVVADKDSSVADVVVSGTAPAVEINGEVSGSVSISAEIAKVELNGEVSGAVTVEEGAAGVEIKGGGVDANQVINNSAENVTVNGETVEGKAEETTTPADDTKKPGTTSGSGDEDEEEEEGGSETPAGHVHEWDAGVDTTPATCTKKGVKTYTCVAEGCTKPAATKTEEIPAFGHQWSEEADEDGNYPCLHQCGETKPENHECDYTEREVVTKKATCTAEGSKLVYCSCGAAKTEAIPRLDHTPVEVDAVAATCTEKGSEAGVKCSVCGTVISGCAETKIDPDAHPADKIESVDEVPANCVDTGLTAGTKCTDCGKYVTGGEEIPVDADNHKTVVTDEAVAATCTTKGKTEGSHCSDCNTIIVEQEEIDMIPHTWKTETTEDEEGNEVTTTTCEVCGAVQPSDGED